MTSAVKKNQAQHKKRTQHLTSVAITLAGGDSRVQLHLDYTDCKDSGHRYLVIKYPGIGTRRSHVMAMWERVKENESRADFREYIDSKQCPCIVVLRLPIQELDFDDNDKKKTQAIRFENSVAARELFGILRLGRLSENYIKDIPREMGRDEWVAVCQLPVRQAKLSGRDQKTVVTFHIPPDEAYL